MQKEIYYQETESITVAARKGEIVQIDSSKSEGHGSRIEEKGKLGHGFAKKRKRADKMARAAMARPFHGFAQKTKPGQQVFYEMLFDQEEMVDRVKEMIGMMHVPTQIGASMSITNRTIRNTNGLELSEKQSWVSYYAFNSHAGTEGYEYWEGRKDEKEWVRVARRAEELAMMWRNAAQLEKDLPIVLSPRATSDLLSNLLVPNLSGISVLHDQSQLKLGKTIGSLTVTDAQLLHANAFDGEGVVHTQRKLIDKGEVTGFLHTIESAKQLGHELTGNAVRGWKNWPRPSPSDLIIEGKKTKPGKHLFVTDLSGTHTVNPISGDFSVEAHQAFILPNWEPVKPFMISGSLANLLDAKIVGEPEQRGRFFTPGLLAELSISK
ncbi:MAG: TldD/PmbA family protein [Candidatus Altiarchaeota archaeon]|nr:TldD/PmbA family protein [Candidatus Altiarchaeota archaeon]